MNRGFPEEAITAERDDEHRMTGQRGDAVGRPDGMASLLRRDAVFEIQRDVAPVVLRWSRRGCLGANLVHESSDVPGDGGQDLGDVRRSGGVQQGYRPVQPAQLADSRLTEVLRAARDEHSVHPCRSLDHQRGHRRGGPQHREQRHEQGRDPSNGEEREPRSRREREQRWDREDRQVPVAVEEPQRSNARRLRRGAAGRWLEYRERVSGLPYQSALESGEANQQGQRRPRPDEGDTPLPDRGDRLPALLRGPYRTGRLPARWRVTL